MSEKIIDRIKKLLALSDSSNEHEAKNAMLMAQKLMAKHNIEAKDVIVEDKQNVDEIQAGDFGKKTWRRLLAKVVSKNFRCDHYYTNRGRRGFAVVFVGLSEDILIAKDIYEFALEAIDKNQKRLYKELRGMGLTTKGIKKSYAIGFTHGLDASFEKQKEELPKEYALVLQVPEVVVDYMEEIEFSGSAPSVNMDIENSYAMHQGYEDGMKFGLSGIQS